MATRNSSPTPEANNTSPAGSKERRTGASPRRPANAVSTLVCAAVRDGNQAAAIDARTARIDADTNSAIGSRSAVME